MKLKSNITPLSVLVTLSHLRMIDFFFRSYHSFSLIHFLFFFYDLYFSWRNLLALWLLRSQSIAFQRRQICEVYYTLSYNERDIQERCHLISQILKRRIARGRSRLSNLPCISTVSRIYNQSNKWLADFSEAMKKYYLRKRER